MQILDKHNSVHIAFFPLPFLIYFLVTWYCESLKKNRDLIWSVVSLKTSVNLFYLKS